MARKMSTAAYNRMLDRFHFFHTEAEALAYVKARNWRKFVISSNREGNCWTVCHNVKRI